VEAPQSNASLGEVLAELEKRTLVTFGKGQAKGKEAVTLSWGPLLLNASAVSSGVQPEGRRIAVSTRTVFKHNMPHKLPLTLKV
jgi:hypothetical protein